MEQNQTSSKLAYQAHSRLGITTSLKQEIEHLAPAINGPSEMESLFSNHDHQFVKKPAIRWPMPFLSKVCRINPAELETPTSDGLIGDIKASLGQHLVDITQAKREASLDPDSELDHVRRNTVSMIKRRLHGQNPSRLTEVLAT